MTLDLEAIKARANAATEGPWEAYNANEDTNYGALWCVANEAFHNPPADEDEDWLGLEVHVGDKPDSDFIAHAREDVPALIAEVERLRGVVDRVREVHAPIDALNTRYNQAQKVCTGCGTDDGNWQNWPCPTIRALEGP